MWQPIEQRWSGIYSCHASGKADTVAGDSPLQNTLRDLLANTVIPQETSVPLPGYLRAAQDQGLADYQSHRNPITMLGSIK